MKFGENIRRVGKMSKRETVLSLMRAAGAENDYKSYLRLLVENPISQKAARAAWDEGRAYATRHAVGAS